MTEQQQEQTRYRSLVSTEPDSILLTPYAVPRLTPSVEIGSTQLLYIVISLSFLWLLGEISVCVESIAHRKRSGNREVGSIRVLLTSTLSTSSVRCPSNSPPWHGPRGGGMVLKTHEMSGLQRLMNRSAIGTRASRPGHASRSATWSCTTAHVELEQGLWFGTRLAFENVCLTLLGDDYTNTGL